MQTEEDFKAKVHEANYLYTHYIYIYIGPGLSISQSISYSLFDAKTQDFSVLPKLKTVPWDLDLKQDKLVGVGFLCDASKEKDGKERYKSNCSHLDLCLVIPSSEEKFS